MRRVNGYAIEDYKRYEVRETGLAVPEAEPLYRPAISNGYAPDDFIVDSSLALYLPLGLLKGSKFKSVDRYQHACTVTGALWRPNGRLFTPPNQYIAWGTPTVLQIPPFTLMAWVKRGAIGNNQVIIGSETQGWGFYFNPANKMVLGKLDVDESGGSTAITSITAWYHVGLTYDGETVIFYIDGSQDNSIAYADPTFASMAKAIGIQHTQLTLDFNGLIGEVWGYTEVKAEEAFTHNRNCTIGRYQ